MSDEQIRWRDCCPRQRERYFLLTREESSALAYQSHCDISHTEYCVTPTSGKNSPKTRYFGWNTVSFTQNCVSFSNVPPEIS